MSAERSGPAAESAGVKTEGRGEMIKAPVNLQDLRRRLYIKAKTEPSWRFWGIYVHVCKMETLREAFALKGSRGRPCVLVMESSEDRIGAHDVGFSAAMARSRSGNRDCRGIGNPRTQPHMGPSAIVMLDPRTEGCPQLSFRQGNDPVQTLRAKGPDHPLAHRIHLWTVWR
jgi:hypothetical protein